MINYTKLRNHIPSSIDIIMLDSVDSTNTYAKSLSKNKNKQNTLIIAKEQTKGKGTKGRSFFSESNKGLYMSYVFYDANTPDIMKPITPAAAIAVVRAMRYCYSLESGIKWVNDIELDQKKLCGILSESRSIGNLTEYIIGIGMNIYTMNFPIDIQNKAVSLCEYCNIGDIELFTAQIIKELDEILTSDSLEYMKEYKQSCTTIGKRICFTLSETEIFGIAEDINERGHLVVQSEEEIFTLISADVSIKIL